MRCLLDQDVYAITARFLIQLEHDVVRAGDLGAAQASDSHLLDLAREQDRILVTRDKDFGGLVFVDGRGTGVIFLRMLPSTIGSVHAELEKVLQSHSEMELRESFVVVEPGRHRVRRLT